VLPFLDRGLSLYICGAATRRHTRTLSSTPALVTSLTVKTLDSPARTHTVNALTSGSSAANTLTSTYSTRAYNCKERAAHILSI
jgi:hypothetical protein